MFPPPRKMTYEAFIEMDQQTDERLEFIDGEVFLQASPSTRHQSIVGEIFTAFKSFFKGKSCVPFISPFDVILQNETETHRVQPDIMIICDTSGLNDKNYTGVPTLVVEVLSDATASRDLIKKMNLYMEFGVAEYWVVSPKNNSVQVFTLENGVYHEPQMYKETGMVQSLIFKELKVPMADIFST